MKETLIFFTDIIFKLFIILSLGGLSFLINYKLGCYLYKVLFRKTPENLPREVALKNNRLNLLELFIEKPHITKIFDVHHPKTDYPHFKKIITGDLDNFSEGYIGSRLIQNEEGVYVEEKKSNEYVMNMNFLMKIYGLKNDNGIDLSILFFGSKTCVEDMFILPKTPEEVWLSVVSKRNILN